jgi:hypothetical protein
MPRFRFTVRRLMGLVAIVAVVLFGILWIRAFVYHRARASELATMETRIHKNVAVLDRQIGVESDRIGALASMVLIADEGPHAGMPVELLARSRRWIAELETMKLQETTVLARIVKKRLMHEHAARRFWLTVAPAPTLPAR